MTATLLVPSLAAAAGIDAQAAIKAWRQQVIGKSIYRTLPGSNCGFSMNPSRLPNGILDRADPDPVADVLHGLQQYRPAGEQSLQRCIGIGDAPQRLRPVGARCPVGHQPKLESPHFEADVKRLVEVRCVTDDLRVPRLRRVEIGHRIDCSAQSKQHVTSPPIHHRPGTLAPRSSPPRRCTGTRQTPRPRARRPADPAALRA